MTDPADQPLGHERVHAKHPKLHGALCRVRVLGGPWVTREVQYVTCLVCLKRLAREAESGLDESGVWAAGLGQITAQMSASRKSITTGALTVRVHARCARYGAFKRSLCGLRSFHAVPFAETLDGVTCGTCRRMLRARGAEGEVAHG